MKEETKQTKINENASSGEEEEWDWEKHPTWVEKNIDKTLGWISDQQLKRELPRIKDPFEECWYEGLKFKTFLVPDWNRTTQVRQLETWIGEMWGNLTNSFDPEDKFKDLPGEEYGQEFQKHIHQAEIDDKFKSFLLERPFPQSLLHFGIEDCSGFTTINALVNMFFNSYNPEVRVNHYLWLLTPKKQSHRSPEMWLLSLQFSSLAFKAKSKGPITVRVFRPQFVRFIKKEDKWTFYISLNHFYAAAELIIPESFFLMKDNVSEFDVFREINQKIVSPGISSFKARAFKIKMIEGITLEEIRIFLNEFHSEGIMPSSPNYEVDKNFITWIQEFIKANSGHYPIDNVDPEECAILYPHYLQRDNKGNPLPSSELKLATGLEVSERTIQRRLVALHKFLKIPDIYRQLGELWEQYFLVREKTKGHKVLGLGGSSHGCDAIVNGQVYSLKCFHNERDKQIALPVSEIAQAEIAWAKKHNDGKIIVVLMNPFWGKDIHKTVYVSQLLKLKNIIFRRGECLNPTPSSD